MTDILITGGGIGGLCASLSLARLGFSVRVFDRGFRDSGTALQLAPNALDCLFRFGLLDECPIYFPAHLRIMDGQRGKEIRKIPFNILHKKFGFSWGIVKHWDLHKAFLSACRENKRIHIDSPCLIEDIEENEERIYARSAFGHKYDALGLIGADGFHSRIRGHIYPALGDRVYRRHNELICRSVIPISAFPAHCVTTDVTLHLYKGGHIVHYPLGSDHSHHNVVVCFSPSQASPLLGRADGTCSLPEICASLSAGSKSLREFLSSLQESHNLQESYNLQETDKWRFWQAFDIVLNRFYRGRFLLLGDAAHGLLPHLSQGGAMALEDGYALYHLGLSRGYAPLSSSRHAMSRMPDMIGDLFSSFHGFRFRRIVMIRRRSHLVRHPWHVGNMASFFRNSFLNITSDNMFFSFLSDIYTSQFK